MLDYVREDEQLEGRKWNRNGTIGLYEVEMCSGSKEGKDAQVY